MIRVCATAILLILASSALPAAERPRARELGIKVGTLPTGTFNAITGVAGVLVGHTTIVRGDNFRTGVTAILPHSGNIFREKVPGAIFVGNGFGKITGSTQVDELGEIETPILLTSTLSVARVADAVLDYMLALPGNEDVRSINPVVAVTNDGYLNDIRARVLTPEDVFSALKTAKTGHVEEGCVGAGTGTIAFNFKAGIGTSSRKLPEELGGYTVGVLVQSNFGGTLSILGAPVGLKLARDRAKTTPTPTAPPKLPGGSIIMVIATDAPVDARNLKRMGARAIMGLARTGADGSNGSGDYAIAFSTAAELRRLHGNNSAEPGVAKIISNDAMSPLFLATIEATEEAIYNSLFAATTMTGCGHTIEALPVEAAMQLLQKMSLVEKP